MCWRIFWGRNRKDSIPFSGADAGSTPGAGERKIFQGHCYLQCFPPELSERGELLGQILPEGSEPNAKGFAELQGRKNSILFRWKTDQCGTL